MISSRKILLAAGLSAFAAGLSWNDGSAVRTGIFSEAQARIGRPLTPMSYAGVARRTTRRVVAAGAAGAYYGSSCAQVLDAYVGSRRAADVVFWLRERWPHCPWR